MALPSPLVMLSVVAVAMAGVAFLATQDEPPTERKVEIAAASPTPTASAEPEPAPTASEPPAPRVDRGQVNVEVYNNSGIKGLAGRTAAVATQAGWAVVGEDNWYGQIPASTVYHPARLKAAAKQLALDLGIDRVVPAVEPMQMDRLTVVLTADAADAAG